MKYSLSFDTSGPATGAQSKPYLSVRVDPTGLLKDWALVMTEYRALVDTGADYCLFDEKEFTVSQMIEAEGITVTSVQTGSGTTKITKIYRLSLLLPDHVKIITLPFVPIDMDASLPFKIILGMNFIRKCDLVVHRGSRSGYLDYFD